MRVHRPRGYTLVELMTVFFILAILVGVILPNIRRGIEKSDLGSCQQNLKNLAHAALLYANDDPRHAFPTALSQLAPTYLAHLPTCNAVRSDSYSSGYEVENDIAVPGFTLSCHGHNHGGLGLKPNEPFWTSAGGLGP